MGQGLDVGRREAHFAAALGAAHHDALHPVRAAENLAGALDVALGDQAPGQCGREGLAAARRTAHVKIHHLYLEVVCLALLDQEGHIARGLVAEAEVRALDDRLRVQFVHQDLDHEVGRGQFRELFGERQDQRRVDPQLGHQFGSAVVRGEQRRVAAGAHDLAGVRVEGDDDGGNAQLTGALHGMPDDQLVPAVDPVIRTDGDDTAPPVLRDVLQATPALHCDRSSSNPCPYVDLCH